MVIAQGVKSDQALQLANRLREQTQQLQISYQQHQITITCSIGLCDIAETDSDLSQIIEHADTALYQAKQNGRNQVIRYTRQ